MANSRSGGNANIDAKIMVPFTQASTLANLTSGENIKTSFGKISKFIDSIQDLVSVGLTINGNIDLNDYTSNGIYTTVATIGTITNGPTISTPDDNNKFTLLVLTNEADPLYPKVTTQIIVYLIGNTSMICPEIYCRTRLSSGVIGAWGDWYKIFPVKTSTTVQSGDSDPITSGAVYSALSDAIGALDVPASGDGAITGFGAGKTLASLTETDGKVNATFQDIDIVRSQVSNLFGIGTLLTSSDNLNSLPANGVYYWLGTSVPTNYPAGARSTLFQFSNTDDTCPTQIVIPYDKASKVCYIRHKSDSTWGNWMMFESLASYDTEPTSGSSHAVQSGGIHTALASKLEKDDVFGLGTVLTSPQTLAGLTEGVYEWQYDSSSTPDTGYKPSDAPTEINGSAKVIVLVNAYDERYTQIVIPQGNQASAGIWLRNNYSSGGATWTPWRFLEPTSNYKTTPVENSTSAITSGGVYTALLEKISYGKDAVELKSTDDLNAITNTGVYYWASTSPANRPRLNGESGTYVMPAMMYVLRLGNLANRVQVVIPTSSSQGSIYTRYISPGATVSVGNWKCIECLSEFDTKPTNNSVKGVTSGGVFNATIGMGTSIPDYADLDTYTTPGRYYKTSSVMNCMNAPLNGYEPLVDNSSPASIGALQLTVEYNAATTRIIQTATYTPSHGATHIGRESIAVGHFWKRWLVPNGTPAGGSQTSVWTPWYQFDSENAILEVSNIYIYNDNTTDGVTVEIKGLGSATATVSFANNYVTGTITHVQPSGTVPDMYMLTVKSAGTWSPTGSTTATTVAGTATTTYNGQTYKIPFAVRLLKPTTGLQSTPPSNNGDEPI